MRTLVTTTTALCLLSVATSVGCAAMRQNMKGQELSFRGAWFCESVGCAEGDMVLSKRGTRIGDMTVATVKLQPRAALAMTAAAPFEDLKAKVSDCKGASVDLPADRIKRPDGHQIGDESGRESWMIELDKDALGGQLELGEGDCATWKVNATATWSDGASFSLSAAIKADG